MAMAITTQPMEIAIVMAKTVIHMADLQSDRSQRAKANFVSFSGVKIQIRTAH
jgi:hypothetical protein